MNTSSMFLRICQVFFIIFGIFGVVVIWTSEPKIGTDYVPTVVNGVASSMSVMAAFSGAIIAIGSRDNNVEFEDAWRKQVYPLIVFLGISVAFMFLMFNEVVYVNIVTGLRFGMTGLLIASETLLYLLVCFQLR